MEQAVTFINEVGFPIAAALGLGFFIWKLINNEIIRQGTMIKTILGVPNLIDIDKIAKADRDDQRKD